MIKIRLSRQGRKKLPSYLIVVSNCRSRRDSKYIEKIGHYNPLLEKESKDRVLVNKQKLDYWLHVGAKPSDCVKRILKQSLL